MDAIAEDLWRVSGPLLRVGPGFYLPSSSTVIGLPDRSLVLYSPIRFDDATAADLDALGEVAHVVAPSLLHHMFAADALARWPRAILHAPRSLAAKRPDLAIARFLDDDDLEPSWRDVLDAHVVAGAPRADETLLFHRATGSLVCADLVFHVQRPANLVTRLVLALDGAGGGRLAQGRTWRLLRKDRAAARASVDHLLCWPIRRVVPCHGEPAELDAPALAPHLTRLYGGPVQPGLDTSQRPD